jgi:cholesterol transport system auxiliary component
MSWRLLASAGLAAAGCALTNKGTPVQVRWYTPELVQPSEVNPESAPLLRLGYVRSGTALGERIVWGDGAFQVGFYDDRRWTERPSEFVTRALRRALFESHRFQPALDEGPQLEVEVVSFQEILTQQRHSGRVALHVRLAAERVLFDDTISEEEPVAGPAFEDVVAAISRALHAASEEAARRALVALQSP